MTKNELKKIVGWAALKYVEHSKIIGVGTGSTVSYFIDALKSIRSQIEGAISSSKISSDRLKSLGIPLLDLNDVDSLDVYVDGADEINGSMQMIKGGGAALTREKILAAVARQFICIADASKLVNVLGRFPLPVEVIPMARAWVTREAIRLGGRPIYRHGVVTDNGNIILDVHNLSIFNAEELEAQMNNISGVVTVGLFARRCADLALISSEEGILIIRSTDH